MSAKTDEEPASSGLPGVAVTFIYALLVLIWTVASAMSAGGLVTFATDTMELTGAWGPVQHAWGPFIVLDVAAAVLATLSVHRANLGQSVGRYRLAVWSLVSVSAGFNYLDAPAEDWAGTAFAVMPIIAATVFEFVLHTVSDSKTGSQTVSIPVSRWLYDPVRTVLLHRRMKLWETEYRRAVRREEARQEARALLIDRHGRRGWRLWRKSWKKLAPASLVRQVRTGRLPDQVIHAIDAGLEAGTDTGWLGPVRAWVAAAYAERDTNSNRPKTAPTPTPAAPSNTGPETAVKTGTGPCREGAKTRTGPRTGPGSPKLPTDPETTGSKTGPDAPVAETETAGSQTPETGWPDTENLPPVFDLAAKRAARNRNWFGLTPRTMSDEDLVPYAIRVIDHYQKTDGRLVSGDDLALALGVGKGRALDVRKLALEDHKLAHGAP